MANNLPFVAEFDLSVEKTWPANWSVTLKKFQLKRAISEGLLPSVFHEGQITFAPTYKFDKGTDQYDTRYIRVLSLCALSVPPPWADLVQWVCTDSRVSQRHFTSEKKMLPVFGWLLLSLWKTPPRRIYPLQNELFKPWRHHWGIPSAHASHWVSVRVFNTASHFQQEAAEAWVLWPRAVVRACGVGGRDEAGSDAAALHQSPRGHAQRPQTRLRLVRRPGTVRDRYKSCRFQFHKHVHTKNREG